MATAAHALTSSEQRSILSIAQGLEATRAHAPELQPDLFGGPLELAVTPYGNYYSELARRIACTAFQRAARQAKRFDQELRA
jgi:hypothetical protein